MKVKLSSTYCLCGTAVSAIMLAVAVTSASAQTVYEADWYPSGAIDTVSPGGTVSTFEGSLGYQPEGLAFDSSGNLYVATSSSAIDKITPGGTISTFASGFSNASSLAFNSAGDLFMDDHNNGNLYEITPGGTVSTFATGLGIDGPDTLAFNSSGNLFVANNATGSILEYTPGGVKSTFASGFINANAIAFNAAGNLFLADNTNIVEFTPKGVETTFETGLPNSMQALAFDGSGNLYVTEGNGGPLLKISPGGTISDFAPDFGNATGLAIWPVPEPSTIALSLLGGAALLFRRLKKTGDR